VLPGAIARTTLTLRRGGHIVGRALLGERGLSGVRIKTEATGAIPSSCPMFKTRNPGPDGQFDVGKVPVGTFLYVKASRTLGKGEIEISKDFTLAKAETVTGTWNFPVLDSTKFGSARLGVRFDTGGPADKGRLELERYDQGWRYHMSVEFAAPESLTLVPLLPPGEYVVRAAVVPGVKNWWSAPAETLAIAPGAHRDKLLKAHVRGPEDLNTPRSH
jgi:hypothetical protein